METNLVIVTPKVIKVRDGLSETIFITQPLFGNYTAKKNFGELCPPEMESILVAKHLRPVGIFKDNQLVCQKIK